ncbi:hypothetical protein [Telluribacter sp. SYSU D00476]|uniref:hypothetical protein n=1 Tax=Telluribacter sp. SYSU D00476 TaxID=2811430 RepID=UPI001FF1A971|nr:hypothetical protein [Telluribacter sp. SYSU D00476]
MKFKVMGLEKKKLQVGYKGGVIAFCEVPTTGHVLVAILVYFLGGTFIGIRLLSNV